MRVVCVCVCVLLTFFYIKKITIRKYLHELTFFIPSSFVPLRITGCYGDTWSSYVVNYLFGLAD